MTVTHTRNFLGHQRWKNNNLELHSLSSKCFTSQNKSGVLLISLFLFIFCTISSVSAIEPLGKQELEENSDLASTRTLVSVPEVSVGTVQTAVGVGKKLDEGSLQMQDDEYRDKRAPRGFLGMRGKKAPYGFLGMRGRRAFDGTAYNFEEVSELYPYDMPEDETLEHDLPSELSELEGDAKLLTMRSKKATSGGKNMRMGFFGLRGKKANSHNLSELLQALSHRYNNNNNNSGIKRANYGFFGLRGRRSDPMAPHDGDVLHHGGVEEQDLSEVEKRAPYGFLGMRG